MIGAPATTQQLRNRLDNLRKMFDEDEDMNQQSKKTKGFFILPAATTTNPDYEKPYL